MKISVDDFRGQWDRLTPAMQTAILATILAAAGQAADPPRRTRHRQFSDSEINGLRGRVTTLLCESPSMPNRVIAERLGISLSTYKNLNLHRFARAAFALATAPKSASNGYGGESACGNAGPDESEFQNE